MFGAESISRRQQSYVDSIFKAFIDGDIGLIAEGHQKLPVNIKFQPLQVRILHCYLRAVTDIHLWRRVRRYPIRIC